jgi:dsRNA-specific ribonuclease
MSVVINPLDFLKSHGIQELQKYINYKFQNNDILILACTDESYVEEHPHFTDGYNQKLACLGKSFFEICVKEILYNDKFTMERHLDVKSKIFTDLEHTIKYAEQIKLSKFMICSTKLAYSGSYISGTKTRGQTTDYRYDHKITMAHKITLARTFHALLAAIYIDSGSNFNTLKTVFTSIYNQLPKEDLDLDVLDKMLTFEDISLLGTSKPKSGNCCFKWMNVCLGRRSYTGFT